MYFCLDLVDVGVCFLAEAVLRSAEVSTTWTISCRPSPGQTWALLGSRLTSLIQDSIS